MILPLPAKLPFFFRHNERPSSSGHRITVVTIVLFTLLASQYPLPPFRPIQVIYERSFLPLLVAPFTLRPKATVVACRLLQIIFLVRVLPLSLWDLYSTHLAIAIPRVALGFIFNRAVGWKFPFLFVHSAGYVL